MIGTRARLVSLMGAGLLAISGLAPASADTVKSQSGNYGAYQVNDQQNVHNGVKCQYETHLEHGGYMLDRLVVRKPYVHSYTSGRQWVGWRFIVKRDHDTNGSFQEVYRSGIVKARASQSSIADFDDRVWHAPESTSSLKGNYKVWLVLFWYKPGSSTKVSGKVVTEIDWYGVRGGGSDTNRQNNCYRQN
ncbi:MAG: hypothetical protein R3C32_09595 [Chloroflexota bacterium]